MKLLLRFLSKVGTVGFHHQTVALVCHILLVQPSAPHCPEVGESSGSVQYLHTPGVLWVVPQE